MSHVPVPLHGQVLITGWAESTTVSHTVGYLSKRQ